MQHWCRHGDRGSGLESRQQSSRYHSSRPMPPGIHRQQEVPGKQTLDVGQLKEIKGNQIHCLEHG